MIERKTGEKEGKKGYKKRKKRKQKKRRGGIEKDRGEDSGNLKYGIHEDISLDLGTTPMNYYNSQSQYYDSRIE